MTIFLHEVAAFFKSGISTLLFFGITIIAWGSMLGGYALDTPDDSTVIWFYFFALVASAGVSNTVFIRVIDKLKCLFF